MAHRLPVSTPHCASSNAGVNRRAGGSMIDLPELRRALDPGLLRRIWAVADPKARLAVARDASVAEVFPHDSLISALDATSPEWRRWLEPAR